MAAYQHNGEAKKIESEEEEKLSGRNSLEAGRDFRG
jgi:hypothetical protein